MVFLWKNVVAESEGESYVELLAPLIALYPLFACEEAYHWYDNGAPVPVPDVAFEKGDGSNVVHKIWDALINPADGFWITVMVIEGV